MVKQNFPPPPTPLRHSQVLAGGGEILTESAPAKINLTLRVLGRRADGYHELESLVAFADLADRLTLEPGEPLSLDVVGHFAAASGGVPDNLVLKAVAALRACVEGLRAGRFHLEKNMPVAAGVGGGSADAAAALRLLARANGLSPDDPRLMEAARAVGADVPVCLASKPRIMRGIGEQLSPPLDLPPLPAVLINPGVAVPTRDVFAKLVIQHVEAPALTEVPQGFDATIALLERHGNDLTDPAIACAPVIAEVLAALGATAGCSLARMSGSGATCFALFANADEAASAARVLRALNAHWWVTPAVLGSPTA